MTTSLKLLLLVVLWGLPMASVWAAPATQGWRLQPARVFDGVDLHEGWGVVVRADKIEAVGPIANLKVGIVPSIVENEIAAPSCSYAAFRFRSSLVRADLSWPSCR